MEKLNKHITKVRSRQRVEPAAVQPVVIRTPALGRREKNEKKYNIFFNFNSKLFRFCREK